jgi:hypothetical protein
VQTLMSVLVGSRICLFMDSGKLNGLICVMSRKSLGSICICSIGVWILQIL